ncbi:tetratricopeptide repeat protein [Algibacter luteus]|uniref:Tetratricopeptide repeat-containing protein n=1 Tax=Algibacter luteus TaxID=1178825 RepID=A0A1M6C1E5_9FLAO|nr:tetratricopeptide repeat protein [Algibacter luteus]WJJ95804.1 tetratricopeptide repeat protein [Algibacter luteus]SHI54820.1 Tetratricopeptide repeat-containing protein [Algibacter luteus]
MKKQIIIALAFSISAFSFAQKKELKTVEKAIKSKNFAAAKEALKSAEALMGAMDENMKSKYYYLTGVALFADGKGSSAEVDQAFASFDKVETGSYKEEVDAFKTTMYNDFLTKGNTAYEGKDYGAASVQFERAYRAKATDTLFLYYAAATAVNVKEYDRALKLYEELKDLGYTGIAKEYYATDKETGEEVVLDKATRDLYVRGGSHVKPGERLTESKKPEIVKNIALIYISNGDNEKALAAIKDARAENPDNVDLIINEANIHLQLKDEDKFKSLIEEAITKDPENAVLHYNVGVVSMNKGDLDQAQKSYEKVLSLDPAYTNAALNLSNLFIEKGNVVIEEMGKLGMSKADDIKYEKLKEDKNNLFLKGAGVLTTFIDNNPEANADILTQLKNIYNALGETQKSKEISAKLDAMSGGE